MDQERPLLESIMQLIMYGGDAKSHAIEAIRAAKQGKFGIASEKITQAQASLSLAHHAQTDLLTKEAGGDHIELTLLMVHGQDHLMNAITFIDMAKEVIDLYHEVDSLKEIVNAS